MAVTPRLSLPLPTIGGDINTWGDKLHSGLTILDERVAEIQPAQLLGPTVLGVVVAQTATAFITRTLAAAVGLAFTNGDGIAGNPTLGYDLAGLANKALPLDADIVLLGDSAATPAFAARKATRTNLLKAATLTAPRRVSENKGLTGTGAFLLDLAGADYFIMEFAPGGGGRTVGFSNTPTGRVMEITLICVNPGATDGGAPTFGDQIWKWPGGVLPAFTASGTDIIKAIWTGADNTVYAYRAAADVR